MRQQTVFWMLHNTLALAMPTLRIVLLMSLKDCTAQAVCSDHHSAEHITA